MNFQLIIPYLEEMRKSNPLSVIGYTRGSACDIVDLHFFPAIANDVLKLVRPVISLMLLTFEVSIRACFTLRRFFPVGMTFIPLGS